MIRRGLIAAGAVVVLAVTAVPSLAYLRPGRTELVDVSSKGLQATNTLPPLQNGDGLGGSSGAHATPSMSADGRYVAFVSVSNTLVPSAVFPGVSQVFLRDRVGHKTTLVSHGMNGLPGLGLCTNFSSIGGSTSPFVSADGRYVAFVSCDANLVPGDTNATWDVFVWNRLTGRIQRANVSSQGQEAPTGSGSGAPALSATGRYVTFTSSAANLVKGDTNGVEDVFVHDLGAGDTVRASVDSKGRQATGYDSMDSSISANGRYVVFTGPANLAGYPWGQGLDGICCVFRRDLRTGATVRVSVGLSPTQDQPPVAGGGGGTSEPTGAPQISATGRYVLFDGGTGFVPNDANRSGDVFVRDMKTGRFERVSLSSSGGEGDRGGYAMGISSDGRYVTFMSETSNWLPQYAGTSYCNPPIPTCSRERELYVYDTKLGSLEWLSRAPDGSDGVCSGEPAWSEGGAISGNGRYVAFGSCATNLVAHTKAYPWHYFVRDRGLELGAGGFGGNPPGPGPSGICVAGTCIPRVCVAGTCLPPGSVVVANDSNDPASPALTKSGAALYGASIAYRPRLGDLFTRIELKDMPQFALANPAIVYGLDFGVRGVHYEVRAAKTGVTASFGLFRENALGLWTKVADLQGGYGMTGEEVVFSLPLRDVSLRHGGRLSRVAAFTALGTFDTGPARILDTVRIR